MKSKKINYKYKCKYGLFILTLLLLSSSTKAITKAELDSILDNFYSNNSELLEEWLGRIEPVVLNGDTLPRDRYETDIYGNVTLLEMNHMRVSDPNCLHGIESCKFLKELGIISGCELGIETIDLSPLKQCVLLSDINLSHNYFEFVDLSPLESKKMLFSLYLSHNNLDSIDLTPLQKCTWLNWLHLDNNRLKDLDLSPLAGCEYLTRLQIGSNELTELDLTPLKSCANLREIHIYQNLLTHINFEPIWDLDSLDYLDVRGNDLDSASCHQINIFDDTHPNCRVLYDCGCF